jgi:hypothetical protein
MQLVIWEVAIKIILKSADMQNCDNSGLIAVNLFFSGLKKVCLIFESPDYFINDSSLSCMKT